MFVFCSKRCLKDPLAFKMSCSPPQEFWGSDLLGEATDLRSWSRTPHRTPALHKGETLIWPWTSFTKTLIRQFSCRHIRSLHFPWCTRHQPHERRDKPSVKSVACPFNGCSGTSLTVGTLSAAAAIRRFHRSIPVHHIRIQLFKGLALWGFPGGGRGTEARDRVRWRRPCRFLSSQEVLHVWRAQN